MNDVYDLVIIGGGSAGLMAAGFAVQLGSRVALVEKHRIGGDCTWTGCVPSKTLLKAAKVAHHMRSAGRYGLPAVDPHVDLKAVMAHVKDVIHEVYEEESPEALRADGIDVFIGSARFLDPHTIMAGENTIAGRNFLIAAGAHPFIPRIPGLEDVRFLTYEGVWDLEVLPRHLMVIGAGPIGCEMAQAFRRLGAEVTLIERERRLLPRDEAQASRALARVFEAEGVHLHLGVAVERVWQDGNLSVASDLAVSDDLAVAGGRTVAGNHLAAGDIHAAVGDAELRGDALLLSVGRRPNVDGLDLDKAGVVYEDSGIHVDSNARTSQRHIYAAGDCTGGHQFTHYAGWQGFLAARNALLPGASVCVAAQVPWTTFTDPEVARVGMGEDEARAQFGDDLNTCEWPMAQVDRARTEGDTGGFMKLVHTKGGTLLGATIVAARAGEMIHEFILAMDKGIKVGDLANAIHVYPTYSTAGMQAAAQIRVEQLLSGTSGKVIRRLARLMG